MTAATSATGLPRPNVPPEQAALWARELFGVEGPVRELGSQQDRNFLVESPAGRHLLKISNPAFARAEVQAQNAAMKHLAAAGLAVPAPVPSVHGEEIATVAVDGAGHCVRLLSFVDGTPLIENRYLPPPVVGDLGRLAGQVSAALAQLRHPGLDRGLQWDLRAGGDVVDSLLGCVREDRKRELVASAAARARAALEPLRAQLPVQAVHGDLTDDNVVCRPDGSGRPLATGIIDFGDTMYSWRVAELAVACTAVFHHEPDNPLAVLPLIEAFHRQVRLTEAELDALWPLIVLRGAVLVVSGEQQVAVDPGNGYAEAALAREWTIFETPAAYDWQAAAAGIRAALGLGGSRTTKPPAARSVLLPSLQQRKPAVLDFGWTSDSLTNGSWLGSPAEQAAEEARIVQAALASADAALARFGEARLTRSQTLSRTEPANLALALEVHLGVPSAVHAPFAGTITGTAPGLLMLEGADHTLFLAGISSTESLAPGAAVAAGRLLGTVTSALTVWLAAAGVRPAGSGEPPRFVRASEFPAFAALYQDPAPLLGAGVLPELPEEDAAAVLDRRNRSYAPLQGHYYAAPPRIERGWKEHLIDTQGRHYLDMVNNVTVLGHGHPAIAAAAERQWRMLNTNSRFHYGAVAELSERLLRTVPDSFDTVLLVNSGTEAVDLALRLAKAFTGREDVLCVQESYHGWSLAADAVSTSTSDNPRAEETRPAWVHVLDAPNSYRGTHRGAGAGEAYARDARAMLQSLADAGTPVGTYIAEPRNGNAGGIGLPPGYLPAVYDAVRRQGGVCISDEVQVGYGRQGFYFWGYQEHGVVPDIITVAKAMGNGHPLGAVITRRQIADALASQGSFFSSSGGSTLSSRIGAAVLEVLEAEGLQENAREVGSYLRAELEALADRQPLIGAVHGLGLYLGIEFVRDRSSLEAADTETAAICNRLRELGVIVQPTGDRQNVLKVKPPLCFTRDSARFFVDTLEEVLSNGW
ncbi:aminotransferase [Arthrobacter mobilis]|uniref:Aminotransferase n=1 Tax=Arthrobacter mobilis TaxID=2724944 RepID=A0A7X6K6P8_9MICC|nr:aminotransferase [Arthrobacter mobilis]NKX55730.1 aminotransferase [Arthrobacter mobilis]